MSNNHRGTLRRAVPQSHALDEPCDLHGKKRYALSSELQPLPPMPSSEFPQPTMAYRTSYGTGDQHEIRRERRTVRARDGRTAFTWPSAEGTEYRPEGHACRRGSSTACGEEAGPQALPEPRRPPLSL